MRPSVRLKELLALSAVVITAPFLLPNAFFFDLAILAGLNAFVCVWLNLLLGNAGQISLGHAAFFGIGAYASALMTTRYGWSPLASLAAGAVLNGLVAAAIARPLLNLKGHYLAMATLGFGIIVFVVINHEAQLTGGPDGIAVPPLEVGGFVVKGERAWYALVWTLTLLSVVLAQNLLNSAIGRSLHAISTSEVAASSLGVATSRVKALVFVISAVMAGVAGSLYAHMREFITPSEAGFLRSVEFVVMVVVGGMGSVYGSVAGAAVLTFLPQLLAALHDYETLVFGLILTGMAIFMRAGLLPTIASWWRRGKA